MSLSPSHSDSELPFNRVDSDKIQTPTYTAMLVVVMDGYANKIL